MQSGIKAGIAAALLALAATGCAVPNAAPDTNAQQARQEKDEGEVITGSRLKRKDNQNPHSVKTTTGEEWRSTQQGSGMAGNPRGGPN
jgi:hypothetical protein